MDLLFLLSETTGAALARVTFGCNQLCLNTINPAPADLLPLYNFICRREVLCTFCNSVIYRTGFRASV